VVPASALSLRCLNWHSAAQPRRGIVYTTPLFDSGDSGHDDLGSELGGNGASAPRKGDF
jgi:hypothetical protein